MKPLGIPQGLITVMPVCAVIASVGIVVHQTVRHDQLKSKLAAREKEIAVLERQYEKLRRDAGGAAVAQSTRANSSAHHHHDGE